MGGAGWWGHGGVEREGVGVCVRARVYACTSARARNCTCTCLCPCACVCACACACTCARMCVCVLVRTRVCACAWAWACARPVPASQCVPAVCHVFSIRLVGKLRVLLVQDCTDFVTRGKSTKACLCTQACPRTEEPNRPNRLNPARNVIFPN